MEKFKIIFNIVIIDYFKLDFEELVKIYNNKIKICNNLLAELNSPTNMLKKLHISVGF